MRVGTVPKDFSGHTGTVTDVQVHQAGDLVRWTIFDLRWTILRSYMDDFVLDRRFLSEMNDFRIVHLRKTNLVRGHVRVGTVL